MCCVGGARASGLFDMSETVFDAKKPEENPGMLAAFLNATLLGKRQHGKDEKAKEVKPTTPPERHIAAVELPAGLPQSTLRDALLQHQLRYTAQHPHEVEAVDWLLGQLDPAFALIQVPARLLRPSLAFSYLLAPSLAFAGLPAPSPAFPCLLRASPAVSHLLLAGRCARARAQVKVPEQTRLLVLEAMIQHVQQHAELQLDAAYAMRVPRSRPTQRHRRSQCAHGAFRAPHRTPQ